MPSAEQADGEQPWLIPAWPAPAQVRALSTLRRGGGLGVSAPPFDALNLGLSQTGEGDDPAAVRENRRQLREPAGLPAEPHWLRQVHGCAVWRPASAAAGSLVEVSIPGPAEPGSDALPEADAAVTDRPGCVLAILTADCLPVLFCADDGSEIAAAHAGWRGLAGGVLEATLAAMRTPPERLHAWLGPAAGPQAYEVGEEVRRAFIEPQPSAAGAFGMTRPGHYLCDLYALARARLQRAGVGSISGGGLCTISDPQRFFSHRRDGRCGRMASLIWITPRSCPE